MAAYQEAKIPLVWWIYQNRKQVEIFVNGTLVRTAGIEETLDGGEVLPGFTIAVKTIFEAGE